MGHLNSEFSETRCSDCKRSIPMSRSAVHALRKDEFLQLMEQLGEAQPRREVVVAELKAMIKDFLFERGGLTRAHALAQRDLFSS